MPNAKRRQVSPHPRGRLRRRVDKTLRFALDMEEPLNDAMEFVQALRMIGNGMAADYDDNGRAIAAVARAALQRLDALEDAWSGLIKAGQRQMRIKAAKVG